MKAFTFLAKRFVAGEEAEDAVAAGRALAARGIKATFDLLGEDVSDRAAALRIAEANKQLLQLIPDGVERNVSIKLTTIGLDISDDLCLEQAAGVLDVAKKVGGFVRIDMEGSKHTQRTLDAFQKLRKTHDNVGIVLQAYLHRSPDDARRISKVHGNVRVCKGIYVEPPEIAHQDRERVREAYMELVDLLLDANCYVGIATHDPVLVDRARASVARRKLPREAYEFQMLLGVAGALRRRLVAEGHRLRVYVPYGEAWYAYSVRRLKENPSIAGHVLAGLFHREKRP